MNKYPSPLLLPDSLSSPFSPRSSLILTFSHNSRYWQVYLTSNYHSLPPWLPTSGTLSRSSGTSSSPWTPTKDLTVKASTVTPLLSLPASPSEALTTTPGLINHGPGPAPTSSNGAHGAVPVTGIIGATTNMIAITLSDLPMITESLDSRPRQPLLKTGLHRETSVTRSIPHLIP